MKKIKAENAFLQSQFQVSKDCENELLKIVWEMKSTIEELIKSQNRQAKNHQKYPQMEIGVSGINHRDAEPIKRIGRISSFTNFC